MTDTPIQSNSKDTTKEVTSEGGSKEVTTEELRSKVKEPKGVGKKFPSIRQKAYAMERAKGCTVYSECARTAGYSGKNASNMGHKLEADARIQVLIAKYKEIYSTHQDDISEEIFTDEYFWRKTTMDWDKATGNEKAGLARLLAEKFKYEAKEGAARKEPQKVSFTRPSWTETNGGK